jgi:hypothetical protein
MQPRQLADVGWGESPKKAPQSGLVWKPCQAQHLQKGTVVLEYLSLVDAAQAHDDREQQGEKHFLWPVVTDPVFHRNIALESAAELQSLAKVMHEPHAAKMSQMAFVE